MQHAERRRGEEDDVATGWNAKFGGKLFRPVVGMPSIFMDLPSTSSSLRLARIKSSWYEFNAAMPASTRKICSRSIDILYSQTLSRAKPCFMLDDDLDADCRGHTDEIRARCEWQVGNSTIHSPLTYPLFYHPVRHHERQQSLSNMPTTDGRPLLNSNGSQTRFDMAKNMEGQKRKKVLVVGAGAAGEDTQRSWSFRISIWLMHWHRHVLRTPSLQSPRQIRRYARRRCRLLRRTGILDSTRQAKDGSIMAEPRSSRRLIHLPPHNDDVCAQWLLGRPCETASFIRQRRPLLDKRIPNQAPRKACQRGPALLPHAQDCAHV